MPGSSFYSSGHTNSQTERSFVETLENFAANFIIPTVDSLRKRVGQPEEIVTVVDEEGNDAQFMLVTELARGASARMFKAYPRNQKALVPIAIKRIESRSFQGFEEEFRQLIIREKTALSELTDPKHSHFITNFYGYYYYPQLEEHWFTMEFCEGGSLYDIARDEVNLKQISAIADGMLRGLEYIHSKGYIHGDIKSGNILLCHPGVVKICDFGLAVKVKGVRDPDLHALGTLDYMAPEQLIKSLALDNDDPNAQRYKYDERIDVWAVGVIILELLLGRVPLHELRLVDEDEFSYYIASMCNPNVEMNKGSALSMFFYFSQYYRDLMKPVSILPDIKRLQKRLPALKTDPVSLLRMMIRPHLFDKRPNPRLEVPKLYSESASGNGSKLFSINKCLDFVAQALFIRYRMRPTAKELRQHPFTRNVCKEMTKLESNLDKICAMYKNRGTKEKIWSKYRCSLSIHAVHDVLERQERKKRDKLLQETL